jgi:hypothetical protein
MTTSTPRPQQRAASRQQGGPPPLAPAAAYSALTIAGVAVLSGGPRPGGSATDAMNWAQGHSGLLHVGGFLTFAAAVPLAIWAATMYRRLRRLGVTAPGAVIGLVGGVLCAASLALSGLITWDSAEAANTADPGLVRVLVDLRFATGAAGFVATFALLLAGIAVPALILRLAPRPVAWVGLGIAAVGMTSTLTLLTSALDPTLPIGRFAGLAWILAVSMLLPESRHRLSRPEAESATRSPSSQSSAGLVAATR